MMIGPDPMMRIFLMSVLFGILLALLILLDQFIKTGKKIVAVMRPRGILRVILHAKKWMLLVLQPFQRLVIQINVGDLDLSLGKRINIHHKIMILGGDFDLPGLEVHDRLVIAVMPKLEFRGLPSERLSDHLMPEADPEHGPLAYKFSDRLHQILHRRRISGTVRKKDSVRLVGQDLFSGCGRGNDLDIKTVLVEFARIFHFVPLSTATTLYFFFF